jgi:hypothetical protein
MQKNLEVSVIIENILGVIFHVSTGFQRRSKELVPETTRTSGS